MFSRIFLPNQPNRIEIRTVHNICLLLISINPPYKFSFTTRAVTLSININILLIKSFTSNEYIKTTTNRIADIVENTLVNTRIAQIQ